MKTKKMILIAAIAIVTAALTAFSMMPDTPDGEKPQNKTTVTVTADDNGQEVEGPCPCSKNKCSCGGTLEYSAKAYKRYTGKKCQVCGGKGCQFCDAGKDYDWVAGCKCKSCGKGYDQANDC
ncbi:MAG: hypothetical protein J6X86_07630 [Bacteroidales bacterium]|nr:hypothetical protein [Bacteroidales bacterium]